MVVDLPAADPIVGRERLSGANPCRRSSNCRAGTVEERDLPAADPAQRLEGFQPFQPYNLLPLRLQAIEPGVGARMTHRAVRSGHIGYDVPMVGNQVRAVIQMIEAVG